MVKFLRKEVYVKIKDFDFDNWTKLAMSDPVLFEKEREKIIEEAIKKVPERGQERLRRLQWRINMKRAQCSNPLSACVHISRMMMDSVFGKGGLKDSLDLLLGKSKETVQKKEAHILYFPLTPNKK